MKLYGFLALILVIVAVIVGSFVGGIFYERNVQSIQRVDSTIILNKIEDEATIITKTVYTDQKSTITVDQGSSWSNFWWGQTITASGTMKVNVGVDYTKISQSDIVIDSVAKTITITLPNAEIMDVSLVGDIDVTSKSGILKLIFDNNPNADYNKALSQLTTDARASVTGNTGLMTEAKTDSINILQLVLKDTGYTVSFK